MYRYIVEVGNDEIPYHTKYTKRQIEYDLNKKELYPLLYSDFDTFEEAIHFFNLDDNKVRVYKSFDPQKREHIRVEWKTLSRVEVDKNDIQIDNTLETLKFEFGEYQK